MMPISVLRQGNSLADTQTVTTGGSGGAGNRVRGFSQGSYGSIADGTSNIYGGAAITYLAWDENLGLVSLIITGSLPNANWTNMNAGGTILRRVDAIFSNAGPTRWDWTAGNPFGALASTVPVTWS